MPANLNFEKVARTLLKTLKIQIIFWCQKFRILCRRRRLEGRRPEKWRSHLETAKPRRINKMAKPFGNSEAVSRSPVLRSKAFGAPSSAELLLVLLWKIKQVIISYFAPFPTLTGISAAGFEVEKPCFPSETLFGVSQTCQKCQKRVSRLGFSRKSAAAHRERLITRREIQMSQTRFYCFWNHLVSLECCLNSWGVDPFMS